MLTTAVRTAHRVELASAHQLVDGRVTLRAASEEGLERLRFVLAVDDDHTEFLRRFARDPMIGEVTRRFRGLRVLRLSSVAHALVRAFCGQLIDTRRARHLEYRIVRGKISAGALVCHPNAASARGRSASSACKGSAGPSAGSSATSRS